MWPYPTYLAHRGGGKLAPENTMAALRCGLEHGFHAVEFDVMLARDGVPVVMHDPYLGRTVAGTGNVFDYDAGELAAMDAGSWFGERYRGETVPLFADFAAACRAHGIWMNIEIKPAPGFDSQTGTVVAGLTAAMFGPELARDDAALLPLLSSFSREALAAARAAAPGLPRALLVDRLEGSWETDARALDAVAIHTNHKFLTPALAQQVKQAGFGLFCYTVNDPARARTIVAWGVDGLCTDRLDLIGPHGPR
ncbi:glycerophosphodiester phosphodiesterase [Massilia sp. PAMC28688]|uniref:glycerophosphodiester phosphodiesterase n=1 Tax=Massilia sp. PAMC28688 TaxID=2861283 RepID=UPI001C625283|nr:glycerophosphodiester phosphodiesterase [Massilia sp. PAMC28688]QYF94138.1 glycerophosphodiester phosphodiesterase [Massilia sp. PAMC28688]